MVLQGKRYRHRIVDGLKWARFTDKSMPSPNFRNGTLKYKGVQYENRVAKLLQGKYGDNLLHGKWIEFEDGNGAGLCQPDLIILDGDKLIIGECKLKLKGAALHQMGELYEPCLKYMYPDKIIHKVQICKHLSMRFKGDIIEGLDNLTADYSIYNLRRIINIE